MRFVKKLTKGLGIFLLVALLLVVGFATWLLKTESGLRWALGQAPDIVQVAKVDGELSDFSFSNLAVTLDGTLIKISSGKLKWSLSDLFARRVNIENLLLTGVNIALTSPATPVEKAPFQVWQGVQLPVDIAVDTLVVKRLNVSSDGSEVVKLDTINAGLSVLNNILTVEQLVLLQGDNEVQLSSEIDLSARSNGVVKLNNQVRWSLSEQELNTQGSIDGTWKSLALKQNTEQPLSSELSLTINDLLSDAITWNGQLKTQANTVQATTEQAVNLDQGEFDLSGQFSPSAGLAGLIAKVSGSISGSNQQFSSWDIVSDLEFSNDTLTVRELSVAEQQTASAPQTKQAKQAKPGQLNASGSIIGVTQFLDGSNGANAKADLKGSWRELGWSLDQAAKYVTTTGEFQLLGVPENFSLSAKASGTSYQKPLQANANIQVIKGIVDIKSLKLNSGESRISVVGKVGEQLALAWDIDSPNLKELVPGLTGDLVSRGKLSGKASAPRFNASANSQRLTYGKTKIDELNLSARGSLSESLESINLDATVARIVQDTAEIARDLKLKINGTGQAHTVTANSVLFGQSVFALNASGGLSDKGWLGSLTELSLDDPTYKKWSLAEPISIKREGTKLTTDRACLANQTQNICVSVSSDESGLEAEGEIRELALNNFNPLLSLYDMSLAGQLNGDFNYAQTADQPYAEIRAKLSAQDSTLAVKQASGAPQTLSIKSIDINLEQQQSLTANGQLVLENDDLVSADIKVAAGIGSAEFNDAELSGKIIAELAELATFQALTTPLSNLRGSLNANVDLAGSISKPIVGMQTRLRDGQLEIPDLGLSLTEITLDARSVGKQKIEIEGGLVSGQGRLEIGGDLNFTKLNEPRFGLTLKGENIELMQTPEIYIDGNIDTAIIITKDLIDVSGEVSLVQADLDFQLPENAVLASDDVVLLGEEAEQQSAQQKINLKLALGDKTRIRAQGLDAYLVGNLRVLQEPGGIMRASGQIDIKDGRYAAYNQKLKIDKGQLIYNGGAIDDPSLLLRAQKSVDETTAGVSVTGRASSPLLQLYSTPSMSDQDVLSVLIFDKRIGDLGSQDGLTLLKIANSLRGDGTSKSQVDVLTENIQETLGLTNLELQLNGNSPSLVAGKQLSSKFYIGYGYGLLDAAQSLILRYKISKAWSIQGDVGPDSGADLRYQIER